MKNKLKFLIITTLSTFALSNTIVCAMKAYDKKNITLNNSNKNTGEKKEILNIIKKCKKNNNPLISPNQYLNLKKEKNKNNENTPSILIYPSLDEK